MDQPSKHKIRLQPDEEFPGAPGWSFELAQIDCETGGWATEAPPTEADLEAAEQRWIKRAYRPEAQQDHQGTKWIEHQCGGCRYFAATGADFGICWNERSPADGTVVFEHGGCLMHSRENISGVSGQGM